MSPASEVVLQQLVRPRGTGPGHQPHGGLVEKHLVEAAVAERRVLNGLSVNTRVCDEKLTPENECESKAARRCEWMISKAREAIKYASVQYGMYKLAVVFPKSHPAHWMINIK